MRDGGFGLEGTLAAGDTVEGVSPPPWEGVSEVILGNQEWFNTWLEAEKKCKARIYSFRNSAHRLTNLCIFLVADTQYHDIIGSSDAWVLVDEDTNNTGSADLRPTNSSRRVKALLERVTGTYTNPLICN